MVCHHLYFVHLCPRQISSSRQRYSHCILHGSTCEWCSSVLIRKYLAMATPKTSIMFTNMEESWMDSDPSTFQELSEVTAALGSRTRSSVFQWLITQYVAVLKASFHAPLANKTSSLDFMIDRQRSWQNKRIRTLSCRYMLLFDHRVILAVCLNCTDICRTETTGIGARITTFCSSVVPKRIQ